VRLLAIVAAPALAVALMVSVCPVAEAQWEPGILGGVSEAAKKILVTVECVSGFEGFGQSREIPREVAGMVVSDTGLVLVPQNMEVFDSLQGSLPLSRPEKIEISFVDGTSRGGEYIGADPDMGVSFFAIERGQEGKEIFPVPAVHEGGIGLGSPVYSVRLLPEAFEPRLEVGVANVSAVITKPRKIIRTQPALSSFKGSPAFSPDGKVVGILDTEGGDTGTDAALAVLAGAVSVRPIELYFHLIETPPAKLEKGWLGIRMEPLRKDLAEAWGLDVPGGILVTETIEDSPAHTAGILEEDILVEVDGQPLPINSLADLGWFRQEVRKKKPGDEIAVKLLRGAATMNSASLERVDTVVVLTQAPPSQAEAETLTLPELGLKARALTLDFLFAQRLNQNMEGIVATYVERAGPADIGEVEEDDIILSIAGQAVPNLQVAAEVFEKLREEKPKEIILQVLRAQNRLFLKVSPEWE
jgi:serine protease Do